MMENDVVVIAEQRDSGLLGVSAEIVGKAVEFSKELRGKVASVLIGDDILKLANDLIAYGADEVYVYDNERLKFYQNDLYASLLIDLISQLKPGIVLFGGTIWGRDLAATIAAKLKTGLSSLCIDLYLDKETGNQLVQVVPSFGKNLMKIICPDRRPQIATVWPALVPKPDKDMSRSGKVINVEVKTAGINSKAKTLAITKETLPGKPLGTAEIVVSGGWGMESAGGWSVVEEISDILGAAVGGTMPAVDAGWIPEARMIGQSGEIVQPKLFLSLGASGAVHYTAGFDKAKYVVAINKDSKAPIFQVADLGIIGDLNKFLPPFIEELKKIKG